MSDINDDQVREYLPGFGRKSQPSVDLDARYRGIERSEFRQSELQPNNADDDGSDDSDDSDSDDDFPTTHELVFKDMHDGAVTSISSDGTGARFATSSTDSFVKLWDYNAMDPNALNSLTTVEPLESQTTINLSVFSPNGQTVLIAPRHNKCQLYDRDGHQLGEFAGGDMYLVDSKKTKGHTATVTDASWSGNDKFATCSHDCTVRIWDAAKFTQQGTIIDVRQGSERLKLESVAWCRGDSKRLLTGTETGLVMQYDIKAPRRPTNTLTIDSTSVGCITPLTELTFLTRTGSTIKQWDLRNPSLPVLQRDNLPGSTSLCLYTDGQIATSSKDVLHILDKSDLETVQTRPMPAEITAVHWDTTTNQIYTGLKNGRVSCLLARTDRKSGAGIVLAKPAKLQHMETADIQGFALSEYAFEQKKQQQQQQIKKRKAAEPDEQHPDAPKVWPQPDQETVAERTVINTDDPREALLKYHDRAKRYKK